MHYQQTNRDKEISKLNKKGRQNKLHQNLKIQGKRKHTQMISSTGVAMGRITMNILARAIQLLAATAISSNGIK